jgi:serine/threonine-protein kinase HipA
MGIAMAHDIGVGLFDQPVGTLSLVGGRLSFQYHADWLAQPNAGALSRVDACKAWFS